MNIEARIKDLQQCNYSRREAEAQAKEEARQAEPIKIELTRKQADQLLTAILNASSQARYEAVKDEELATMMSEIGISGDKSLTRAKAKKEEAENYDQLAHIVARELA